MTRRLLALACCAFPSDHRARTSGEVVDTAVLAADGSTQRTMREGASLVVAGIRQRLRAEAHRSAREGLTLLAGTLALVNLAVASAGIYGVIRGVAVHPVLPPGLPAGTPVRFAVYPVMDWWWIAFALAAAGVVLGLFLGNRWLAVGAVLANLVIVGWDAVFLADNSLNDLRRGHLDVFTAHQRVLGFPAERQWLAVAGVLAVATIAAPLRRRPLRRLGPAAAIVLLLVVLSRALPGSFFYLRWPILALVVLAMAFGAVAPRLAVLAVGVTFAAAPAIDTYMTHPEYPHPATTTWGVVVGLALGVSLLLVQLARRRLA